MGTNRLIAIVIALWMTQLFGKAAVAANIYVDDSHTSGTLDGTSWTNSFQDIQDALDVAVANDVIHAAQGSYYPSVRTNPSVPRSESFSLIPSVIIMGGYIGYNDASPDTRDPDLYPTILSGDIGTPSVSTDNCYHVVTANGVSSTTILDGFTIEKGQADQSASNLRGAGIEIIGSNSSPQFFNCIIRNNYARRTTSFTTGRGGGVYASPTGSTATITFTNCEFLDNESGEIGGAVYISNALVIGFYSCEFSRNRTSHDNGTDSTGGGAIFLSGGSGQTAQLIECRVESNSTAAGSGGGMWCGGVKLEARNCDFVDNEARRQGSAVGMGGGVFSRQSGELVLVNCRFVRNIARHNGSNSAGGGLAVDHGGGPHSLINCEFIENSSDPDEMDRGNGGGLLNLGVKGVFQVINCLFVGNHAHTGGAVFTLRDQGPGFPAANFFNCTIAQNDAISSTGGVRVGSDDAATFDNCILWANTDSTGGGSNAQQVGPIGMSGRRELLVRRGQCLLGH